MWGRSVVGSALLLVACRHEPPGRASPTDAEAPKVAPFASVRRDPSGYADKPPECRVMSGENGPGPHADATKWLDSPAKSSFAVRMQETGRELRFEGPAHLRPCAHGTALLASGVAMGLSGAGDSPGNESWVATPCGVVRWAGGITRVTVEAKECRVQVSVGTAFLWTPPAASIASIATDGGAPAAAVGTPLDGWRALPARIVVRIVPFADPDGAVRACEDGAARIESLSATMGDAGTGTLGELAASSVAVRRSTRAACALAMLRAEGQPTLEGRVAVAARW